MYHGVSKGTKMEKEKDKYLSIAQKYVHSTYCDHIVWYVNHRFVFLREVNKFTPVNFSQTIELAQKRTESVGKYRKLL